MADDPRNRLNFRGCAGAENSLTRRAHRESTVLQRTQLNMGYPPIFKHELFRLCGSLFSLYLAFFFSHSYLLFEQTRRLTCGNKHGENGQVDELYATSDNDWRLTIEIKV